MAWVHCSYTESFNCTSLGTFCFVMLMKFLFDLLSQCILASTTLSSAPGGPFDSGATTAFLGSKPGFFWSSECICICLLVVFFPYLCLYHVTIQSIPVLVPCLYGAQKVTPGWAWGLCMRQKAPECLEISIKISMLYFFLLSNIPAVGLPTCWSKESMWKCLHSMCAYYQSPSGFVWLFWCVQFFIWCLLVTFLIQGQSPKKDCHLLMEGGAGREMG